MKINLSSASIWLLNKKNKAHLIQFTIQRMNHSNVTQGKITTDLVAFFNSDS